MKDLPTSKERMSQFADMMTELTALTGKRIENTDDMYYLYNNFAVESYMNLTLPKWAYTYFPDGKLLDVMKVVYSIANSTPLLKRLHAGKSYQYSKI